MVRPAHLLELAKPPPTSDHCCKSISALCSIANLLNSQGGHATWFAESNQLSLCALLASCCCINLCLHYLWLERSSPTCNPQPMGWFVDRVVGCRLCLPARVWLAAQPKPSSGTSLSRKWRPSRTASAVGGQWLVCTTRHTRKQHCQKLPSDREHRFTNHCLDATRNCSGWHTALNAWRAVFKRYRPAGNFSLVCAGILG